LKREIGRVQQVHVQGGFRSSRIQYAQLPNCAGMAGERRFERMYRAHLVAIGNPQIRA